MFLFYFQQLSIVVMILWYKQSVLRTYAPKNSFLGFQYQIQYVSLFLCTKKSYFYHWKIHSCAFFILNIPAVFPLQHIVIYIFHRCFDLYIIYCLHFVVDQYFNGNIIFFILFTADLLNKTTFHWSNNPLVIIKVLGCNVNLTRKCPFDIFDKHCVSCPFPTFIFISAVLVRWKVCEKSLSFDKKGCVIFHL